MSGMQILRLEAEKVKRLRAVTLNLEGKNLVVVGKPDAGKTTALDLVWLAFCSRAIGPETISAGADEARISVVIGNPERQYTITRKLTRDGERAGKLTVKCSDGGAYGAKFLDTLISDLSFDPTVFARAEGKVQTDLLLQVVKLPGGVSIDGLDRERAGLYEKRTVINRDVDRLKARLPVEEPPVVAEVSLSAVLAEIDAELAKAREINQANTAKRAKLDSLRWTHAQLQKTAEDLEKQIAELSLKLKNIQQAEKEHADSIGIGEAVVAGLVDVDEGPIHARRMAAVGEAEATNKAAQARKAWEQAQDDLAKVKTEADCLTRAITEVDLRKKSLLESVEWPVPGLSIRDGQVTYNNVILSQCGMSVRMRVSCAIAMALNPKLKAIRIDEGESLGEEGRQELFAWAAERGYQVLMSVVKDGPAAEGELEIIGDTLTNEQPVELAAVAHG